MSIMAKLLRLGDQREPENYQIIAGTQTAFQDPSTLAYYGGRLPDQLALTLPTFFRAKTILTDLSGQLPLRAVRGGLHSDARTVRFPEIVDPQPKILIDPSPWDTRSDVIAYLIDSLVMRGNAFMWLSGHDNLGFPTIAVPIDPDSVSVRWNDDGSAPVYEWRGETMTVGFDFLHIKLSGLLNSPVGVAPLFAGMPTIAYGIDAMDYGGEFFKGSATPAGTLQHPGRLDFTEAQELSAQWDTLHAGGRGTAVLSGGITYAPVSITPEQAQFLATRAFDNQQIASLLGIPQHLVNAGQPAGTASSLTYANLSMILNELYRMTLFPTYLTRVEAAFTSVLPRGQSARFDANSLLRADDANRYTAYKTALETGALTTAEIRELEGRPPLTDAEMERVGATTAPAPPEQGEEETVEEDQADATA